MKHLFNRYKQRTTMLVLLCAYSLSYGVDAIKIKKADPKKYVAASKVGGIEYAAKQKTIVKRTKKRNRLPLTLGLTAAGLGIGILSMILIKNHKAKPHQEPENITDNFINNIYIPLIKEKFKNKKGLRIVLGAGDSSCDYSERFKNYTFVMALKGNASGSQEFMSGKIATAMDILSDNKEQAEPILILMDFNSEAFFNFLDEMAGCFSEIIFDSSVTKFASWKYKDITHIHTALAPGGNFYFPRGGLGGALLSNNQSFSMLFNQIYGYIFNCDMCFGTVPHTFNIKRSHYFLPPKENNFAESRFFVSSFKVMGEINFNFSDGITFQTSEEPGAKIFNFDKYFYQSVFGYFHDKYSGGQYRFTSVDVVDNGPYPKDSQWINYHQEHRFDNLGYVVFTR